MELELIWINLAMKRWREGLGTPPAECPPVECGQSDGATGTLDRKDRVSQSGPDAGVLRPVSGGEERAGVGLRPNTPYQRPVTFSASVQSKTDACTLSAATDRT